MNLRVALLALIVSSSSCREVEHILRINDNGLPEPIDLSVFNERAEQLELRLINEHLKDGYVVSYEDSTPREEGDALLWTGLAIASLPCHQRRNLMETLFKSVDKNNGAFLRIDPLPSSYSDDPTSRDMEVGALFGVVIYSLK